jgi:putative membrane protein
MVDNPNEKSERSLIGYLGVTMRGFFMGAADVVPGVSGGTIALLFGIYHELVDAINAVNTSFLRKIITFRWKDAFAELPWKFLVALATGIGFAIITLSRLLHYALDNHPVLIWSFFFGLVLASVIVVLARAGKFNAKMGITFAIAAVAAYFLLGLRPGQTPDNAWFLFISGAIAICAMILPGISGAFILVLLGKYQFVLNAVVERDLGTIAIVGMGAVVGILSFSRLLKWLLRRYYTVTISILAGLMFGSLRILWPWKESGVDIEHGSAGNVIPTEFTSEVVGAIFLMVTAFVLVILLEYISSKRFSGHHTAVPEQKTGS